MLPIPVYNYLDRIIRHKQEEVEELKQRVNVQQLQAKARESLFTDPPRDFAAALAGPGVSIIAEVKRASPSAGNIRQGVDPVEVARLYEAGGASAISVLTDQRFFSGRIEDLVQLRHRIRLPLLRKDFIIDPVQVYESRVYGADAILLIATCLTKDELDKLYLLAAELGMECLVEVHTRQDIEKLQGLKVRVVGVNNRDLTTFKTQIQTSLKLYPLLPEGVITVAESGIASPADIGLIARRGFDAALIGEALMRTSDPIQLLRMLRRESAANLAVKSSWSGGRGPETQGCPVKAKICGLTRPEDALAAAKAGAAALGLVFTPKSRRCLTLNQASDIVRAVRRWKTGAGAKDPAALQSIPASPVLVGVFADQPVEYILSIFDHLSLDAVQLHGSETPQFCRELRARLVSVTAGRGSLAAHRASAVWPLLVKSLGVSAHGELLPTQDYIGVVDGLLLDTQTSDGRSGGTGQVYDWNVARRVKDTCPIPVIVAGGLTPDNVGTAIAAAQPYGVDVSSGVENGQVGLKDFEKIRQFLAAVMEAAGSYSQKGLVINQ